MFKMLFPYESFMSDCKYNYRILRHWGTKMITSMNDCLIVAVIFE